MKLAAEERGKTNKISRFLCQVPLLSRLRGACSLAKLSEQEFRENMRVSHDNVRRTKRPSPLFYKHTFQFKFSCFKLFVLCFTKLSSFCPFRCSYDENSL